MLTRQNYFITTFTFFLVVGLAWAQAPAGNLVWKSFKVGTPGVMGFAMDVGMRGYAIIVPEPLRVVATASDSFSIYADTLPLGVYEFKALVAAGGGPVKIQMAGRNKNSQAISRNFNYSN